MISLHLVVSRGPKHSGYTSIDEPQTRPIYHLSLLPIVFAFAAGCGCVALIDLAGFLASSPKLIGLLVEHGTQGLPTVVLGLVAMLALYSQKSTEQSGLQVGEFVASLAAVGMVITAIMWCTKF
ncbi:hypothetical protein BDD12DRAFT_840949 [Trichophaea hybrida]|nr:hypothetical protein BDD12DRAFT_840949 [Trichophaea hybrida]